MAVTGGKYTDSAGSTFTEDVVWHQPGAQPFSGGHCGGANDVMQAGVAEDEAGEGFILLFMGNVSELSRQNTALGLDSHCVVTQDHGTAYGCVREVTLSGGRLMVSLDPAAFNDLGLEDPEIEAELDVPDEDVERMREVLAQVLAFGRADACPQRVDL